MGLKKRRQSLASRVWYYSLYWRVFQSQTSRNYGRNVKIREKEHFYRSFFYMYTKSSDFKCLTKVPFGEKGSTWHWYEKLPQITVWFVQKSSVIPTILKSVVPSIEKFNKHPRQIKGSFLNNSTFFFHEITISVTEKN